MTRVEQRTQKLIEQLGTVAELVNDRTRVEAAEIKRAARALTQLLKRKPVAKAAANAGPAARRKSAAGAAKTGRAASVPVKRASTSKTKDGRSLSEVRRAAAFKAWETKRSKVRKRKAR